MGTKEIAITEEQDGPHSEGPWLGSSVSGGSSLSLMGKLRPASIPGSDPSKDNHVERRKRAFAS